MNDVISKIKSGSLSVLLSVCSKEDLAPLVDYIKDKLSNSLEENEKYKKHSPDHTKYTDLIADEIQLYGGNTVSNLARGGKGPDYEEILFDVCQKLGIPSKRGWNELFHNEINLLRIYLPYGWEKLSSAEQENAVKISVDQAMDTYGGDKKTFLAASFLRGIAVPVAAGLLAKGITDPAYTVTIPCTLHITYLRWKVLNHMENHRKKTLAVTNVNGLKNNQLVIKCDSPIFLGEDADKPILTLALAEISKSNFVNWEPVSESDGSGMSRFNSLLQLVPGLATKAQVATTQYIEINIPLESLSLVKGSTTEYRAFVRGANGQFVEHAQLTMSKPENLTNLVNAGALFQIVSVVVAQKHLADISQKLTEINEAVNRVLEFQNDERKAKMTGAIDYFRQIAPSILACNLDVSFRQQIEKYEGDLLSVRNHLRGDIEKLNKEIESLNNSDMFGSDGMKQVIDKHQKTLFNLYQQQLLCIQARACGWQLLLAFPGTEDIAKNRKRDIDQSLNEFSVNGKLVKQTIVEMDKKIRKLSAISNTALTLNQRKIDLLKWQDELISEIVGTQNKIDENLRSVEELVFSKRSATKFLLKVEGGEVVSRCPL